jgi:hypothetical protein
VTQKLKEIVSVKEMQFYLRVSSATFRKKYIAVALQQEQEKGIRSGIIITGTNKKASYKIVSKTFLRALEDFNKTKEEVKVCLRPSGCPEAKLNCGGRYGKPAYPTTAQDIDLQLERMLSLKL